MQGRWLRVAHRRRWLFLGIMLVLVATLGWLGWRLVAQDEQLARQRAAEQRDTAADLVVVGLERRLSTLGQELDHVLAQADAGAAVPTFDDAIVVRAGREGIRAWPERRLLYYPDSAEYPGMSAPIFAKADELEFRTTDPSAVIKLLEPYTTNRDSAVAASALVQVARNYLKSGRLDDASNAYTRLAAFDGVVVGGMPAVIAAHLGQLSVSELAKDNAASRAAAQSLSRLINSGQLHITAATYSYVDRETRRWKGDLPDAPSGQVVLAEGTEWLLEQWSTANLIASGSTTIRVATGRAFVMWRASPTEVVAFLAGPSYLRDRWLGDITPVLTARHARLALTAPNGETIVGAVSPADHPAVRLASDTGLPWTIQIANTIDDGPDNNRRLVVGAGLFVLLSLILVGAWFIDQTVARELALADLQSDFVSAVSHEFRTPLTTLCQLSELLMRDRVASDDDRGAYYRLLHQESQRLRRLVEGLLNFGRIEAGRMQFSFEPVNPAALVREVVDDFAKTDQGARRHIDLFTNDGALVSVDREMLRSVVWNLVENAAKYSPTDAPIAVQVAQTNGQVRIAVRDRGTGIPESERGRIFEKFVRGAAARDVGGTGVGLAVAQRIVHAHGGDIRVDSEPGQGSTFSVLLPAVRESIPVGVTTHNRTSET